MLLGKLSGFETGGKFGKDLVQVGPKGIFRPDSFGQKGPERMEFMGSRSTDAPRPDLLDLDEEDIDGLGLKKLERKRFQRGLEQLRA